MSEKQKHPKRPRDINQRAASTVALATEQTAEDDIATTQIPESTPEERHLAAAMLGKKGGLARAEKLTPEQRSEIAKKAAKAKWHKPYQDSGPA